MIAVSIPRAGTWLKNQFVSLRVTVCASVLHTETSLKPCDRQ